MERCFVDGLHADVSTSENILFDGVPRNLEQVPMLDRIFVKLNKKVDLVIFLQISENEIENRILNRWICDEEGRETTLSGKENEIAEKCEGVVRKREDDNASTLSKRLDTYKKETFPLVDFYRKKGILKEVNASLSVEEVSQAITGLLNDFH